MPIVDVDDDPAESTEEPLFAQPGFRAQLRELPPSAKLVAKVLDVTGPLDHTQLAEETLLPDRTVRYALTQLEDANLVTAHVNLRDARKQVYELQPGD
jgi:DNA-binding transcriptional ArsR family regulator